MKNIFKLFLASIALGISFYALAYQDKIIRIYQNGEIIKSYKASDIDYIQVDDYVEEPDNIEATIEESSITISWAPISGAQYSIYRSVDNVNFGLIADGIEECYYIDEDLPKGTYFYRVIAIVNGVSSDYSASIEVSLIEPVKITDCSTTPLDLSISIWKDSQRYFLTPEQFKDVNLEDARVEGLSVTARTGNFIISPTLLNSTDVNNIDALVYYYDVLPTSEQAITISARYLDINAVLEDIGWPPFVSSQNQFYYLTKSRCQGNFSYALDLNNFTGGELTQSDHGYIRGVSEIPDNSPIQWQSELDMTLATTNDGIEGLRICIGDQDFIIELRDKQTGSVKKDAAMALYADILPSKNQADVIAMRYADINQKLMEYGGDEFSEGEYLTSTSLDSEHNYAIEFSQDQNATVIPAEEGKIRGIINLNEQIDSVLIFSVYNITHSLNAADDDVIGKINLAELQDPRNKEEIIYLERDAIFLTCSPTGEWNRQWAQSSYYGNFDGQGIRPYAGKKYVCAQTGETYIADEYGQLHPDETIENTITVTTWNLGGFNKGNSGSFETTDSLMYQAILNDFKEVIDSIKPDLMGCCEFLPKIYGDSLIRNDLFGEYPYATIPEISLEYQGKAFFSQYPLYNATALNVGQSIALEAEALINHQVYRICIIQPTWWKSEIDNNWIELSELAQRYKYVDHVILMGDFNVLKDREPESWQLFTDAGFTLGNYGNFGAFPTTYNSFICSMVLDNIMVKGAEILEVSTIQFTPEGLEPSMPNPNDKVLWDAVNASDHFPFSAIIRILNR